MIHNIKLPQSYLDEQEKLKKSRIRFRSNVMRVSNIENKNHRIKVYAQLLKKNQEKYGEEEGKYITKSFAEFTEGYIKGIVNFKRWGNLYDD